MWKTVTQARRLKSCALTLLATLLLSGSFVPHARADKSLRIVVPFSAGSTIDALARQVANALPKVSEYKSAFVENKSGAAGIIGTAAVSRAEPDGYTILLQANGLTTTPAVRNDLPFDTLKDLAPITLVGTTPYALIAPAELPYDTLGALFDHAHQTGERVTFGTSGQGSQSQLVLAQISKLTGVSFLEVPFRGQAETMLGVMGGQVQLALMNLPSALLQLKDRRIKLLATLTNERTAATPDVPSLPESGMGNMDEVAWYGFLAPSQTPPNIVTALNQAIVKVLQRPEVQANLTEMGIIMVASTPDAFADRLRSELAHYRKIAMEEHLQTAQ